MPKAVAAKEKVVARPKDLVARVVALRDALAEHGAAPKDPPKSRALRSAWDAHLGPRMGGILRRLDDLARADHWEFGDDDEADLLRPKRWPATLADLAMVHAEVTGALLGLTSVRVSWEPVVAFGVFKGKPSAKPKGAKKPAEPAKPDPKAPPSATAATNRAIQDTLAAIRTGLAKDLQEVRDLVAAIQEAEETRLRARSARLAEDSPDRAKAEEALDEMREARIDGRSFRGDRPSRYGSILRQGWLRHWLRAVDVLD